MIPAFYGLEDAFESFRSHDLKVEVLSFNESMVFKPNFLSKLMIKFIPFTDHNKILFSNNRLGKYVDNVIDKSAFDIVLLVKGLGVNNSFLYSVKACGARAVLFMWDPLKRYETVLKSLNVYDLVITSQYEDVSKLPNAKFNPVPVDVSVFSLLMGQSELKYDFIFVGKYTLLREQLLQCVIDVAGEKDNFISLVGRDEEGCRRQEYLEMLKVSRFVLDLNEADQTQWTVRLVDGLCLGKIVISNSSELSCLPPLLRDRVISWDEFLAFPEKAVFSEASEETLQCAINYFSVLKFLRAVGA